MSRRRSLAAMLAAGLLAPALAGCITVVGPDPVAPQADPGAAYDAAVPAPVGAAPEPADRRDWWTAFRDPVLDRLVTESLAGNPGLQEAASRVREAQALSRGVTAEGRPTLDLDADAGIDRTQRIGNSASSRTTGSSSSNETSGALGLGLGFGWVPDLFGGQQRAEEAAQAEVERQAWLRRDTALALVAETTRTYVSYRGTQALQALAAESLDLQVQTLTLVEGRTEAGLAPQLDLSRAQAAVASLQAALAPTEAELQRLRNALAVLAGRLPGSLDLPDGETGYAAIPVLNAGPPIGLPVDLLRRRPDLRAAEAALIATTAEIGVAEAEFYPSLSLPGSLSLNVSGLGTGSVVQTIVAALGAALNLPLYDGGLRQANLDAAQERALQALLAYRTALLAALQQVEAALLAYQGASARLAALEDEVAASETAFNQAETLYRQGLASFLDVLDAQRELTTSRRDRVVAATNVAQATMDIYEAAGLAPDLPPVGTTAETVPQG
ncbi:efflux transporter outer membrane subunit [Marinibaculum pumilum]|uniref:Efflux transporter outer membrane subunit n=1 Tax=Marinibaculum pumilum TaxID=1766165 RepID=A0ABV7L992_9PROT